MEAFQTISTVLTIREYDKTKLASKEVIAKILEAGRLTASARNMQPWEFVVVTEREKLVQLGELSMTGRHIANASFAIAVVTDPKNKWHEIDAARAIQSMTIEAWETGLGNCWVGAIEREKAKELLKIPKELNLLTILPFGYPTRKYRGKKDRKPLSEIAFQGSYGSSF